MTQRLPFDHRERQALLAGIDLLIRANERGGSIPTDLVEIAADIASDGAAVQPLDAQELARLETVLATGHVVGAVPARVD